MFPFLNSYVLRPPKLKGRVPDAPRLRHRQAPSTEHAKPRPDGARLGRSVEKKLPVSSQTVAKATQMDLLSAFSDYILLETERGHSSRNPVLRSSQIIAREIIEKIVPSLTVPEGLGTYS